MRHLFIPISEKMAASDVRRAVLSGLALTLSATARLPRCLSVGGVGPCVRRCVRSQVCQMVCQVCQTVCQTLVCQVCQPYVEVSRAVSGAVWYRRQSGR